MKNAFVGFLMQFSLTIKAFHEQNKNKLTKSSRNYDQSQQWKIVTNFTHFGDEIIVSC